MISLCCFSNVKASDYGCVSYWSFDEGSGNIAYDSIGINDGILHGAYWEKGISGNAVKLDGYDDYIELANNYDLKVTLPLSISIWIKFDSFNDYHNVIFVNDKWRYSKSYNGICLTYNSRDNVISINYGDGGTGAEDSRRTYLCDYNFKANYWYHIVAIIKDYNNMDIYIDGDVLNGDFDGWGGTLSYSSSNGYIGQNGYDGYFVDGIVDEVKLYEKALTKNEVNSLYHFKSEDDDWLNSGIVLVEVIIIILALLFVIFIVWKKIRK